MAEIDSLGSNFYYSGVQNSTNEAIRKNQKKEDVKSAKKSSFSKLLEPEEEPQFITKGLPPEISEMTFDDAVIYLKDAVDLAGNDLSENVNEENIKKFKDAVSQFISFVVANNFEVTSKKSKRSQFVSPVNCFSTYNTKPRIKDPKMQINVINEKLMALTKATMQGQMNNLKILAQVDEIKGLIVDLMSS